MGFMRPPGFLRAWGLSGLAPVDPARSGQAEMIATQVLTMVPDVLNEASGRLTILPLRAETMPRKSRDSESSRKITPVGMIATRRPRGLRNFSACSTW